MINVLDVFVSRYCPISLAMFFIVEVISMLVFRNVDMMIAISWGALLLLCLYFGGHPLAKNRFPSRWLRVALLVTTWIILAIAVTPVIRTLERPLLQSVAGSNGNESEISETLLGLTQLILADRINTPSPQISIAVQSPPAVTTPAFSEASLSIKNRGESPILVSATGRLESSNPGFLRFGGVTYSLKWQGSTAEENILLPGESDRINVVAYGPNKGIILPILGPGGAESCLNFLTPDENLGDGYLPELCQRDYPIWSLAPHEVAMTIDIYASAIGPVASHYHERVSVSIVAGHDLKHLSINIHMEENSNNGQYTQPLDTPES